MKPPGGKIIIIAGIFSGRIVWPKNVPAPRTSLKALTSTSARVKPAPMPNASMIEGRTGFLPEKASARPNMMQLTTIRGMKIPRAV